LRLPAILAAPLAGGDIGDCAASYPAREFAVVLARHREPSLMVTRRCFDDEKKHGGGEGREFVG
jgi:hypothetical protein